MKQEHSVQVAVWSTLDRIRSEYAQVLQTAPLSLEELFSSESFQLEGFGKGFAPHAKSEELQTIAEQFGRQYGIWLENAKHYITCTLFLYPTAGYNRLAAIVKNNAVDYFLNDTMGRDVFSLLTADKQQAAQEIVERMATLDDGLVVAPWAHPVELANAEVLNYMRQTSPGQWFREFLKFYSHHIGVTHKDLNSPVLGQIAGVSEYIEMRIHTAGMHHIMLLIEYSTGNFLDWRRLEENGLLQPLKRLHFTVAAFGALSNDLFSFEKEVIDNNSDSNLVMSILLNDPALTLREAILQSAEIVGNLLAEYSSVLAVIRRKSQNMFALANGLSEHLEGVERCLEASWLWQVYTKRYKRPRSIWAETTLASKTRGIAP